MYVHSMMLQLKLTFVPPAIFLHSPVLQAKLNSHKHFSFFTGAISVILAFQDQSLTQKYLHKIKKLMLFLDHRSDSFHWGIVLKLWVWFYSRGFVAECAIWFKFEGIKRLNFPPKGPSTVKIWDMESLIIVYLKWIGIISLSMLNIEYSD